MFASLRRNKIVRPATRRVALVAAALCAAALALASAALPYEAETVADGGSITGVVKYAGPPMRPAQLEISKDKEVCGAAPLYDQSLIVGHNGGIANAVVTITDIAKGKAFAADRTVTFDQKGCEYVPHVVAFAAGDTVNVINSDGILHSIHTESTINPVVDMAQPGFKHSIAVTVAQPEAIKVNCDAHNWMQGWWYVAANPYYSVTDAHGNFSLADVPAGTYKVSVWQEKLGTTTRKVIVKAGAPTVVDFTLAAK
ncbi:MAG: carboxypeptidase regulatory-like domain-containing protein [Candidatus Binataceae bacterium]|nr:carboxypeptidase regulatory-like domain-containing protein [Candidatus Binataceae bacterium]